VAEHAHDAQRPIAPDVEREDCVALRREEQLAADAEVLPPEQQPFGGREERALLLGEARPLVANDGQGRLGDGRHPSFIGSVALAQ